MVKALIENHEIDRNAEDGAGRSTLEIVEHILSDDVGGRKDFKANLEEIRRLFSQVNKNK